MNQLNKLYAQLFTASGKPKSAFHNFTGDRKLNFVAYKAKFIENSSIVDILRVIIVTDARLICITTYAYGQIIIDFNHIASKSSDFVEIDEISLKELLEVLSESFRLIFKLLFIALMKWMINMQVNPIALIFPSQEVDLQKLVDQIAKNELNILVSELGKSSVEYVPKRVKLRIDFKPNDLVSFIANPVVGNTATVRKSSSIGVMDVLNSKNGYYHVFTDKFNVEWWINKQLVIEV